MFIGRKKELEYLEEKYRSSKAELVIVYGRRRIGKTETIIHFAQGKDSIYFMPTLSSSTEQLESFSRLILDAGHPASPYTGTFASWEMAFSAITELPTGDRKQILIIDEFSYLAHSNQAIPSILQKAWDTLLRHKNIMLIICGSSMSFMEKELLSERNPLYGRATGIWKMEELPFNDARKFFPDSYTFRESAILYSILGGIPYYLEQMDQSLSMEDNIRHKLLRKGSVLYSEPEVLIRQEFREPAIYNMILRSIAAGNTSLGNIYSTTGIEKNKIAVYLKNLVDIGILVREFPISTSLSSRQNMQRGTYRIMDSLFNFWYGYIYRNISLLEADSYGIVFSMMVSPNLNQIASSGFERICTEWLKDENNKLGLPFIFTSVGRWWSKSNEIDIVALDSNKKEVLSCECKFHNSPIEASDIKKHIGKDISEMKLGNNARVQYMYFSLSGYTEDAIRYARMNDVLLVCIDDGQLKRI